LTAEPTHPTVPYSNNEADAPHENCADCVEPKAPHVLAIRPL
jgi:hypothetical protein